MAIGVRLLTAIAATRPAAAATAEGGIVALAEVAIDAPAGLGNCPTALTCTEPLGVE